jgi:hypothetical protein
MQWWLRALGVLGTCVLAIHTGLRTEARAARIAFPLLTIGVLVSGTWEPIWNGFHETFPAASEESALASIIEFCAVATSLFSFYFLILRPRILRGYKVLPAQVIAFGMSMVGVGLLTAAFGLFWQFRQNWNAGISPAGAPVFSIVKPQIQQTAPNPALPPPRPTEPTPFFSGYRLTDAGVDAFGTELYAIRDAISKRIDLGMMSTDPGPAGNLLRGIRQACDQASVECPLTTIHPNSPDERGLMIYVLSPDKPSEAATKLQEALLKIGLKVPFVARPAMEPTQMILFAGPAP